MFAQFSLKLLLLVTELYRIVRNQIKPFYLQTIGKYRKYIHSIVITLKYSVFHFFSTFFLACDPSI